MCSPGWLYGRTKMPSARHSPRSCANSDQIERQVSVAPQAATAPQRYHFDPEQLIDDVRRIRAGIDAYLTPERAQPRNLQDVSPISGNDTRQFEMGVRP